MSHIRIKLAGALAGLATLCLPSSVLFAQQPVLVAPRVAIPASAPAEMQLQPARPVANPEGMPPPRTGLSLSEIEARAMGSNPSLQRASAMIGAARGTWIQAGLLPNPVVGYQGQQVGSGGLAEQHGVVFNQDIITAGKLGLSQAIADREMALARQNWETQRLRVITDARIAYYQTLAAQRQIDLTHELVRVSQKGTETVQSLLKAMDVGRADLLQAELEVENATILAQNARQRHAAAWRALAAVTGDASLPMQPLAGDLFAETPAIDYEEALVALRTMSPEVASAAIGIERAEAALERARVESVPNISFQGLYNWQDQGIGGKPDGSVGIVLPWPLFNRNQGNILRAEHEVAAAHQALHQVELDLSQRFAGVYERYANARYQVDRYRSKVIPAATESLDLTRKSYAAGESGYISLLTAQRTFAQIQLNYLEAVQALRIAEAEIDGQLLRDSWGAK